MKPPYRDYVRYALIMVRRNSGRKGWKTLIRHAGRVDDDAVHDPRADAPCRAGMR
ncbi:hypothetical protein [Burkholderia sp. SIMBA_062]|uniref:hypothetical protein n=1 Tax=Burkholderia sp. SIMBA_062 TaxID=3085803 RepID=UPI00397966B3